MEIKQIIEQGNTAIGIEFGSTRIKAVLVDRGGLPLASGDHLWENRFDHGFWTYSMDEIWSGMQDAYAKLATDVQEKHDVTIRKTGAIGISAMMHGYLAFDKAGQLLVPFRTWRNTSQGEAADRLTEVFDFNIPQRWSIAHLYQAVLNQEEHVKEVAFFTTLAGYIHWQLTGEKVLGIGDASGMFPIDSSTKDYDSKMLSAFGRLMEPYSYGWSLDEILPKVLVAGEHAGTLTKEGAKKLDVSGNLEPGILFAPPEGDAGTGMVATNSVKERTGNVSAGTSIFAMVVLEKPLNKVHKEIDLVTTPSGEAVAMVHCNNCTSDINAWAGMFREFSEAAGAPMDMDTIYTVMFQSALNGEPDCGELVGFNYFSGEPVTGFEEGRPLLLRKGTSALPFANLMRLHLYSAVAALKYGLDILFDVEQVAVVQMYGHGGYFKTPIVGQKIMAAAMNTPVTVMETAGEGGPWGMAILALYAAERRKEGTLSSYLEHIIFAENSGTTVEPDEKDVQGFSRYMDNYVRAFAVEKAAIENC